MFDQHSAQIDSIFLLFLGVFLALCVALLPSRLSLPTSETFLDDANEYHSIAVQLVTHGMYSLDSYSFTNEREPGYSIFLALIYALFGIGNRAAIFIAQALIHAFAVFVFARAAQWSYPRRAVNIASFFLLLSPAIFHMVFFVYRESLALSLFLLSFAGIVSWMHRQSTPKLLLTSLVAGFAVITYLPFLVVIFAYFLFLLAHKKSAVIVVAFLLFLLPVGSWAMRNLAHESTRDCPMGGCLRSTAALYMRGRQATDFTWQDPLRCLWVEFITRRLDVLPMACDFTVLKGVSLEKQHLQSISYEAKTMILSNIPMYVWTSFLWGGKYHFPYVNGWGKMYNVAEAVMTLLVYGGIGLTVLFKKWRAHLLLWLPIILGTVLFALIDVEPRYRMPFFAAYTLLSGVGYSILIERYTKKSGTMSP